MEFLLILQSIREALGEIPNNFFVALANISVAPFIFIPALIIFWLISKRLGLTILFSLGIGFLINGFLKCTFCIYRPWILDSRIKPPKAIMSSATGYSFPSGHSTIAGSFWGSLFMFFRKKHLGIAIFCIAFILLTMFARMFLGVHTPQDVVVGALSGIVAAVAGFYLINKIDKKKNMDIVVWTIFTLIIICLLIYYSCKTYPMDYVEGKLLVDPKAMQIDTFKGAGSAYGIFTAWLIERRFLNFEIKGSLLDKVVIALVGGFGFMLGHHIAYSLSDFIGSNSFHFISQFLLFILFMVVYPICIQAIQNKRTAK